MKSSNCWELGLWSVSSESPRL